MRHLISSSCLTFRAYFTHCFEQGHKLCAEVMQVKIMRSLLKNVIERSSLLKLRCKSGQDSHHLPHPPPPLHLPPPPSPQQKKKNCVCVITVILSNLWTLANIFIQFLCLYTLLFVCSMAKEPGLCLLHEMNKLSVLSLLHRASGNRPPFFGSCFGK